MFKLLSSPQDARLYQRLLGYVRPYRALLGVSLFAMLVLAAADAAKAALLKPMLDGAFIDGDPDLMVSIPLYLIALFVLSGLAAFVSGSSLHWVANRVVMDIKNEMFARILSLPARFFDRESAGAIVSRFTYDAGQIKEATTSAVTVMVKDTLVIAGLLLWMVYLDWRMTLITLLGGPFILLIALFIRRRLRDMSRKVQETMSDLNRIVNEAIKAGRIIRLHGGQDFEKERFFKTVNANRRYTMKFVNAAVASGPAVQLVAALALAVIIYYASGQAAQGDLSVGTFVSFFAALVMMLDALRRLVKVNEYIQKGLAASESVFGLLDESGEVDSGTLPAAGIRGEIVFEDLVFSYDGDNRVLDGVNLVIQPRETVALVGASGSGKTSLAYLIPRFYQPEAGVIRIDGRDIREYSLASLREAIGLVSQDIVLFDDTVRNNIAYGRHRDAGDAAVTAAAAAAHALEFIRQLPGGMDTPVGENGTRLSGGQRQRLALARALLKHSPILILDEATSSLDAESERHIRLALEELRHRHTCIIIAHRLTTIESADRIVVLDGGRIVEAGTHAELVRRQGPYARLYASGQTEVN